MLTVLKYLAPTLALAALAGASYFYGKKVEGVENQLIKTQETLQDSQDALAALQDHLNRLQLLQKAQDEAYAERETANQANQRAVAVALRELRNRPTRSEAAASAPAAAQGSCEGTTGAQLSREDAEFLVGEASRANRIREALKECYAVLDAAEAASKFTGQEAQESP